MANQPAPKQPARQPEPQGSKANSLEELQYIHQLYQNQYALLTQEINRRIEVLRQLDSAQKALEDADKMKGSNILIPVGADVYFDGKLNNTKNVVLGIGAGYLLEKDIDGAKSYIAKAVEKETEYINRLAKSKKELEAALIEVSYKIQEISH